MTSAAAKITPIGKFRIGVPVSRARVDLEPKEALADFRAACDLALEGVVGLAEARIVASTRGEEAYEAWLASRIAETISGLLGWWTVRVRVICSREAGKNRISARVYGGKRQNVDYGSCSVGRLV